MSQITPSQKAVSTHVSTEASQSKYMSRDTEELTPSKSKPPMPSIRNFARYRDDTKISAIRPPRTSQTLAARPSKQRPSVQGAFTKPLPNLKDKPGGMPTEGIKPSTTILAEATDSGLNPSPNTKMSSQTSSGLAGAESTSSKTPASSAALREAIAKAKAARHKTGQPQTTDTFPSSQMIDGIPELEFRGSNKGLLRKRVASALADGRLNIAAMGLKEMPIEVLNMYNTDTIDAGEGTWYESVDLVKLIAADNELENIGEDIFPDVVAEADSAMADDFKELLFAGLNTLDLHGNHLQMLPLGIRRLQHLTTLNLSKNKLGTENLNIITQIKSLRELRVADNALDGVLTPQVGNLEGLEVLDISNNSITALPPNINENSKLRILDVAGNRLSSLPFELMMSLPLIEIHAARNRLGGVLFPTNPLGLLDLKFLDVANNALTSIVGSEGLELPSLQSFNVTENRLTQMPELLGWTELLTLTMAGNRLASLPESLIALRKLKSIDCSRNNIKKLDERFGLMESLTMLRIAHNPLRERKFLTMDTETIKYELRSRILPEEPPEKTGGHTASYQSSGPAAGTEIATIKAWHIRPGGVVDRSSADLKTIEPSDLDPLIEGNDVKTLILHHNLFTQVPQPAQLLGNSLRMLDISSNKLTSSNYILTNLLLPNLKSINLLNNTITSLSPLLDFLSAPQLLEINVSRNRLTSLPLLRECFPALASVHASQNSISELEPEPVKGLQVLDVSGNAITRLDPKLGLLGSQGLRTLLVGANKFRVPKRDVIEKGTESLLAWLKCRIPEQELQRLG